MAKYSVMCTFQFTYSLRDIEAADEDAVIRLVSEMGMDDADSYGHCIGEDVAIDSIGRDSRPKTSRRKAKK